MFIKDISFQVEFSDYAESHFCKDFCKKYRGRMWIETKKTIVDTLQRAFLVQNTSLIDDLKFSQEECVGIFKFDFKIAGTPFSPKTSGNRVIFFLDNNMAKIKILLVYGKVNLGKRHSETQWVLEQIKANFPEYRKFC